MSQSTINRNYKDRLFRLLFGTEEHKKDLLELYNALAGTDYTEENDLTIMTIDDAVYMSMKNDASFLLESILSLFEQQSSFNPNMPLRGFMYFAKQYDGIVKKDGKNLYGSRLIKIPTPRYYVFYNGEGERPDRELLKLSDAFEVESTSGGYEWTAVMLNINKGHNKDLMDKCQTLKDYADFIAYIREKKQSMSIQDAMSAAVEEFKKRKGTLAEYLIKHEAEVYDVCITEYNEQATFDACKKEAYEDGRLSIIAEMIKAGRLKAEILSFCSEKEYEKALEFM